MTAMTQEERLMARITAAKQGDGLYRLHCQVVNGKIMFWTSPEFLGKLEGVEKEIDSPAYIFGSENACTPKT